MSKAAPLIILTMILLSSETIHAVLTGGTRAEFIDSASRTCFKTQRSASINSSIIDNTLQSYCSCFSIYMADMLNNELVKSIVNGEQKLNPALMSLAGNYCMKNYSGY